mmetsp:Transcript_17437/g.29290  ORF Transcript_17437/g.29290 Transcript_17437/m.29290 type:complete len:313 (+) Transcript_17437:667-1605(+)
MSIVRRTITNASPLRFWLMRRSARAWVDSGFSGSYNKDWSRSSSQIFWESFSTKQSVKYTFAIAAITSDMIFFICFFKTATVLSNWVAGPLSCASSACRMSRHFSKLVMAVSPLSRCPSSMYLAWPWEGSSSILFKISSLAPAASPSSARVSAARSRNAAFSGSSSRHLTYNRKAPSSSPFSTSFFARCARTAVEGMRISTACSSFTFSHFRSGSWPSHSIVHSKVSTSACKSCASKRPSSFSGLRHRNCLATSSSELISPMALRHASMPLADPILAAGSRESPSRGALSFAPSGDERPESLVNPHVIADFY